MGTVPVLLQKFSVKFSEDFYRLVSSILSKTNKPLLFHLYFHFTNLLQEGRKSESYKNEAVLMQDSKMVRHPVEVLNYKHVDSSRSLVFWQ